MSEDMRTDPETKYPIINRDPEGLERARVAIYRTLSLALDFAGECSDPLAHVVQHHRTETGLPEGAKPAAVLRLASEIVLYDVERYLAGGDLARLRGAIGRSVQNQHADWQIEGNREGLRNNRKEGE